jgi:hypothetical protein
MQKGLDVPDQASPIAHRHDAIPTHDRKGQLDHPVRPTVQTARSAFGEILRAPPALKKRPGQYLGQPTAIRGSFVHA